MDLNIEMTDEELDAELETLRGGFAAYLKVGENGGDTLIINYKGALLFTAENTILRVHPEDVTAILEHLGV